MFVTENESWEGELGEKMSCGEREREGEGEMPSDEPANRVRGGDGGRWRAGESPDEGVEMMGWQFPTTRLFFRAVKHIVRHCLKCPG